MAWVGNEKADQVAKQEALRLAPSNSLCQQRALHQQLHVQACRLIGAVQEMHMHHARNVVDKKGPSGKPAFPRKRKRATPATRERQPKRRQTGPRIAQEAWESGAHERGQDADLLVHDFVQHQAAKVLTREELFRLMWNSPGDGREGLHTLQVVHGPASRPGGGVRTNGTVDIALACTTCQARASNTGRWVALTQSQCGPARPLRRWTKHPHAYMADVQGRTCIHCGLRTPGDRGAHAWVGACPAERLFEEAEEVFEGTILLRGVLGLRACWLAWARGPQAPPAEDGASPPSLPQQGPPPPAPRFLEGYREHLPVLVGTGLCCLRCGCLPRDQRIGFTMQNDKACSANLATVSPRVITGLSTFTLQHSVCLAGSPHWELWRALIAHCVTVAQERGTDAMPVAGDHHVGMGWGSEAFSGGGGLMLEAPVSQGRSLAAPGGVAMPAGGRWARSLGRSRTPRMTATAPLREVQRARLIAAFGRGASRPQVQVGLPGRRPSSGASLSQSCAATLAASTAQDPSNREGSRGTHAATALGRIGEAILEGPSARASTHGAGVPPLVCGMLQLPEGMCRAGARPIP